MRLFAIFSTIILLIGSISFGQNKFKTVTVAIPVLLIGRPNDLAINVIKEYSSDPKRRPAQIQRTKVILGFKTGTTVAQVNNLIRSMNGSLDRTFEKSPILEIIIPNSRFAGDSESLLQRLRKHPHVDFAMLQLDPPRY